MDSPLIIIFILFAIAIKLLKVFYTKQNARTEQLSSCIGTMYNNPELKVKVVFIFLFIAMLVQMDE